MPIYPSDVDDVRRGIGEAAMLVAAAIIYARARGVIEPEDAVKDAEGLLFQIRDSKR